MKKLATLLTLLTILYGGTAWSQTDYYTTYSITIGQILDSPGNKMTLPDGSKVEVNRLRIGNAAGTAFHADFGKYNGNILGGFLDGVSNNNSANVGNQNSQALTLPDYEGNRRARFFTRIVSDAGLVDAGQTSNLRNAVGYYIHTTRPQIYNQFLMMDLDGVGLTNNQEWIGSFAYEDDGTSHTLVKPNYTLSANTYLQVDQNRQVHSFWQDLVRDKTGNASLNVTQRDIVRKVSGGDDIDPDDIDAQVLINFGNKRTTDVFFLWGIWGQVGSGGSGNGQNSGLSPLVFKYNFDFGDAPGYNTILDDDGARHSFTNAGQIYLGASVNREPDGDESSPNASTHVDDNGRADASVSFKIHKDSLQRTFSTFEYPVFYTNNTGQVGHMAAWIDWDGNGKFSSDEGVTVSTPATGSSSSGLVYLTWNNKVLRRSSFSVTQTFIRIRYTTDNLQVDEFKGGKSNGEVEDYAIVINSTVLPVDLLSFDVRRGNGEMLCNWRVANQHNIDAYKILKSTDGKQFEPVADIKAQPHTSFEYHYALPEAQESAYYKLAVYDRSGEISYSGVRYLSGILQKNISIYPNPAKDNLNVVLMDEEDKTGFIYSATGQLMRTLQLKKGLNKIDISPLPNGIYFLGLNKDLTNNAAAVRFEVRNKQVQ